MNYLETVELYYEQGAYESASLVCLNAFKSTENSLWLHASQRFLTASKYSTEMHSSAELAAYDAMTMAREADEESNLGAVIEGNY